MGRGIEKREIFLDPADRYDFLSRLGDLAGDDRMQVLAFCLMPNHFHLLVRTLATPLSTFMGRLLTGYATYFNRRHDRVGHVFQNRFKSLVVDDEQYLFELIRYIHLNPIRSNDVPDLDSLCDWPFSGHGALMGKILYPWIDTAAVLANLASTTHGARRALNQFMVDGLSATNQHDLGDRGTSSYLPADNRQAAKKAGHDDRIMGNEAFVAQILDRENKVPEVKPALTLPELIETVANRLSLSQAELCSGTNRPAVVTARAIVIWLGAKKLGLKTRELSETLCVKPTTIYMSLTHKRGESESRKIGLEIL